MTVINLPTSITLFRLAMAPIVAALIVWAAGGAGDAVYWGALGVFTAAALTDWVDGWLARTLDQRSTLGAALDHSADKALVTAALVALAGTGLPSDLVIPAALILTRDVAVAGLREGLALDGRSLPVNHLGKVKTVFEMLAVACLIGARLPLTEGVATLGATLLWGATGLAVWSGGVYFTAAFRR